MQNSGRPVGLQQQACESARLRVWQFLNIRFWWTSGVRKMEFGLASLMAPAHHG
jgi:hypothetical protein